MGTRREFLKKSSSAVAGASVAAGMVACTGNAEQKQSQSKASNYSPSQRLAKFQQVLRTPVFNHNAINVPVIIENVEIFQSGQHYFTKVTSKDGAFGISVNAKKYITNIYPIILNRIAPLVKGKDARDIERLIEFDIYKNKLNYKWQGLALWVGVAYVELAILDLLGKTSGLSMGELLGGRVRDEVNIYFASPNRENKPEEEVEHLLGLVEKSGAQAVKYRLGARMHYTNASTKRDKALIPLVRKHLGSQAIIYADANGSYDVGMGIKIGKILQAHDTAFFEEPCPFDHYEETKAVADALQIPVAGGEEESSTRQFMWLMDKNVLSVVQPDLLFHGGLIRSIKIARMAQSIGIPCTPHISGYALGFLNMLHFASCVPNIGPYQEFKGDKDQYPVEAPDAPLIPVKGKITIPKGPGLGVFFAPSFFNKAKLIKAI